MAKRLGKRAAASRRQSRMTFAGVKGAEACNILRKGTAHGRSLNKSQRGLLGARCGEFKKRMGLR